MCVAGYASASQKTNTDTVSVGSDSDGSQDAVDTAEHGRNIDDEGYVELSGVVSARS